MTHSSSESPIYKDPEKTKIAKPGDGVRQAESGRGDDEATGNTKPSRKYFCGTRGHSFLTTKYSYAYVHTASPMRKEEIVLEEAQVFDCEVFIRISAYSVSENRNGASQNNQTIIEAKYFGTSREQFRALVHPQFRESPVIV